MTTQEKPNKKTKKLMKDVGFQMPIGIIGMDGELHKGFAFKPWRLKEEKELGALKEKLTDATMPTYVSAVLSTMCTRIGPHDFTAIDSAQKALVITQMYVADVFYLYLKLRTESIGAEMPFELICHHCSKKIKFTGDLGTVSVESVNDIKSLEWEYKLVNPVEIREHKIKMLKLTSLRWNAYEALTEKHQNEGELLEFLLSRSIYGTENTNEFLLVEGDLDELGKKDYTNLSRKMTENGVGPDMAIETKCPFCKSDLFMRIEWEKNHFFDDSSQ